MREQQADARLAPAQGVDQDGRGPGLAQRNGMDPQRARLGGAVVAAEALLHRLQVARLGLAAPAQLAPQQRLGGAGGQGVQQADHAAAVPAGAPAWRTRSHACQTASTDGAGEAKTQACRVRSTGPVRHAVSKL